MDPCSKKPYLHHANFTKFGPAGHRPNAVAGTDGRHLDLCLAAAGVAAAQLRLGVMYENGIGMRVNYKVSCLAWLSLHAVCLQCSATAGRCKHHDTSRFAMTHTYTQLSWV